MEPQFWSKEVPSTPIILANGRKLVFDTVDGITGYAIVADPGTNSQLAIMMAQGRGGLSRTTAEAYATFIQKKSTSAPLKKQWREELKPGGQYAPDLAKGVVEARPPAAIGKNGFLADGPGPSANAGAAANPSGVPVEFRPRTARRQ